MRDRIKREKKSGKKVVALIFVFISVFCIVFFAARGKFETPVTNKGVGLILSPFQNAASWIGDKFNFITTTVSDIMNVHEQNKMLMTQVEELKAKNLAANEFEAENQRLRALLNYKESATQFDLLAARVIGRDPTTWSSMIVINRGSTDGVANDMAVVTEMGLVGHVIEAGLNTSKVQLILDPRASVGTLVQRPESRVAGIVEGDINNPIMPKMINIPKNSDVIAGDMIVTSGFGGIYPKGIVIGRIKDVQNEESGLLKYGVVETTVNFQKLEDVAIIIQSREAPPDPIQQKPAQQ